MEIRTRLQRLLCTLSIAVLITACTAHAPAPAPAAEPEAGTIPVSPEEDVEHGFARVSASTLNVRRGPQKDEATVATLRKGARVGVLRTEGGWTRVSLAGGEKGWVASKYLKPDRCPADREFRFLTPPVPAFSEGTVHGSVVVEALVDAEGKVLSTKIRENTTGDQALAAAVVREIGSARFVPPIRNCAPKQFIYAYRRTF